MARSALLVVLFVVLLPVSGSCQVWDLSRDFPTASNPRGPWAVGSAADRFGELVDFTDNTTVGTYYGSNQLLGWSDPASFVFPYVTKNVSATDWLYDGTSVGGGPLTLHPGQVFLSPHAQPDLFAIAQWTAPRPGFFTIQASYTRIEQVQNHNSNYFTVLNGADLAGGSGLLIGFGNPNSTGSYASPELALAAGDKVKFAIGFGTDSSDKADGTLLNAVIRSTDGVNDLVLQDQTGRIALISLDGFAAVSSVPTKPNLPPGWRVAAAGDFNGDGRRDIVVQNTQTGAISLLLMNGNIVKSSVPVKPVLPPNWSAVAAGDVDGDGNTDLIVQNTATHQIATLFMNGTTMRSSRSFSRGLLPGWSIVGTGDFSGDGRVDLVAQNASDKRISVITLNGLMVTGSAPLYPSLPADWSVGGVTDLDSDGKLELVVQNGTSGRLAVLRTANLKIAGSVSVWPAPLTGWKLVGPR